MNEAYIVDAIRTPVGRYGGALKDMRADDLGAVPLRELMRRNPGVDWSAVDDVVFGCANQAGEDNRNVAHMSSLLAGLPPEVAGTTVNRLCGSGMDAIGIAARAIRSGETQLMIAGGVESMTRAPFVMGKAESAFSRQATIYDTTIGWRFPNKQMKHLYGTDSMPETAENVAVDYKVSREDQDRFALASQQKTARAWAEGLYAEEIVPVLIPQKKGDHIVFAQDEHPRETSIEALAKLKGVVHPEGSVTAGNASGVNDGAAALLLASAEAAGKYGLTRRARIVGMATAGVPPRVMGIGPAPATKKLMKQHELAHSWSGNLVTFATANDAWLNEGFTSYVENRIVEELYGKERADMENVIARNELRAEYTDENTALQRLAVEPSDLDDPDENLTGTVYTKGAWMLQWLEQSFGREAFDAFLRQYFDHFAFDPITTEMFVAYAKEHLLAKYPGKVTEEELAAWIHEPGIPATAPETSSARFDAVDAARAAWLADGTLPDAALTDAWTTQEWVHFIEGMPETLEASQLEALDAAYGFTGTSNGEIAQRWYPIAVRSGYEAAHDEIATFLEGIGRRKLIMPTYEALVQTPEGLALAKQVFERARPGYHPITTGSVERVIAEAE